MGFYSSTFYRISAFLFRTVFYHRSKIWTGFRIDTAGDGWKCNPEKINCKTLVPAYSDYPFPNFKLRIHWWANRETPFEGSCIATRSLIGFWCIVAFSNFSTTASTRCTEFWTSLSASFAPAEFVLHRSGPRKLFSAWPFALNSWLYLDLNVFAKVFPPLSVLS